MAAVTMATEEESHVTGRVPRRLCRSSLLSFWGLIFLLLRGGDLMMGAKEDQLTWKNPNT